MVRKMCPSCASTWTSTLPNCPFCGALAETAPDPNQLKPDELLPLPDSRVCVVKPAHPLAGTELEARPHRDVRVRVRAAEAPPNGAPAALPPPPPPVKPDLPPRYRMMVLGVGALLAVAAVPLTLALEGHRVLGILGLCACGLLAPFAPLAWFAGQSCEDRFRAAGARPPDGARLARLLGLAATSLLVLEFAGIAFLVAALRIAGHFPSTFRFTA
jgi:hypothetical protein